MRPVFQHKINLPNFCKDVYSKYPTDGMVGLYYSGTPALLIRDPEILKQLFGNAQYQPGLLPDQELDPLLAKCPPLANGGLLLQSVISDANMRDSYEKLFDVRSNFSSEIAEAEPSNLESVIARFSANLMVDMAFGYSFDHDTRDPDYRDALYVANSIKEIFESPGEGNERMICLYQPWLAKERQYRFVPKEVHEKLRQVVRSIISRRPWSLQETRFCLLRWMVHEFTTRFPRQPTYEENLIVEKLFMFFVETHIYLNVVGNFALAHLARSITAQKRVREEIANITWSNRWTILIDRLNDDMTYMDLVIKETLRLHPPLGCIVLVSKTPTYMREPQGPKFYMKPGDLILLPILAMHMDSMHWPNPEAFDPDRFREAALQIRKDSLPYVTYEGNTAPKFHMLALKVMLATVLKYDLSANTSMDIKSDGSVHFTSAKGVLAGLE